MALMATDPRGVDGPAPAPRQWLSPRQAATVASLLDAGLEAIHEGGHGSLSLRDVATRAGVTHTTAYTYFTSKEHLVAEISWRALRDLPVPPPDPAAPLATRLTDALRGASEVFSQDPAFAEAALAAMVGADPDIRRLRDAIGAEVARRIEVALGPDADPRLRDGALLLFSGAMLQAGLGYFTFDEVVTTIGTIAELWDGGA